MNRYVDVDKVLKKYSEDGNWDLHKVLKGESTADVRENVHGEWLPKWSEFFKRTLPYCSRCLKGFVFETDFCPHCGADMRKGETNGFNSEK